MVGLCQVSRQEGGEVHLVTASDGEVTAHEGVLDIDVLRKTRATAEGETKHRDVPN